jgi:hypothetical protein
MLYADKENLKTTVAQELLSVREKEMGFYERNLSMVGTHATLVLGFSFTILSNYQFQTPVQGYLSYAQEEFFGLAPLNTTIVELGIEWEHRTGISGWTYRDWFQQLFQLFHLISTIMGILLQLWTVYTCELTNILGLHMALRGPDGSVDRAVSRMAEHNTFALRRFMCYRRARARPRTSPP